MSGTWHQRPPAMGSRAVVVPVGTTASSPAIPYGPYSIATTGKVVELRSRDCPVAIGVSGGKDSIATALRLAAYLDEIGHRGPRILIHADLGEVEWKDSLPVCERLAERIGWELVVVRRRAGGMMQRWEKRWENNLARHRELGCVQLILPWSTPAMRFCTSELKTSVICSALKKRFPGQDILSVTGVRHQESAARAKMPVASQQKKLTRRGAEGWNWNPIIEWSTEEVFQYIGRHPDLVHEAYTRYGSTRVSCAFCIMGSIGDLNASASCPDNHAIYRRMVALEVKSGFSFQNRWLGDVAPHRLDAGTRAALGRAKEMAKARKEAEARIPKHLRYTRGWPTCIPTRAEAELLAEVRRDVFRAIRDEEPTYVTPESIMDRYAELAAARLVPQSNEGLSASA